MSSSSYPSSHVTTLYRQNLATFLFYSDVTLSKQQQQNNDYSTSWIGDTARSLSLRAATPLSHDDDDNETADSCSKRKKKKKSLQISSERKATPADIMRSLPSSKWSDFICMSCGTLLFPPVLPDSVMQAAVKDNIKGVGCNDNDTKSTSSATTPNIQTPLQSLHHTIQMKPLPSNIYIRPLKRGRTRRRRASRAKAKELHNRSLSIQRRGTSNTNMQLQSDTLLKERIERVVSSYRLGDGRAKNCLVMKCTYCGTKKKRKGVLVKADTKGSNSGKRKKVVGGQADKNAHRKKGSNEETTSSGRIEKETKNVISQKIRDNTDYISLSSLVGASTAKKKNDRQGYATGKRKLNDAEQLTSPLLAGKKKKKKKKPAETTKKGGLMDFLSSLND